MSGGNATSEKSAPQGAPDRAVISQTAPSVHLEVQTSANKKDNVQVQGNKHVWKKHLNDTKNHSGKLKSPWKPPGRHAF